MWICLPTWSLGMLHFARHLCVNGNIVQVANAVNHVQSGTTALQNAKKLQKNSRKWMCIAIIILLIIIAVIVIGVVKPWKSSKGAWVCCFFFLVAWSFVPITDWNCLSYPYRSFAIFACFSKCIYSCFLVRLLVANLIFVWKTLNNPLCEYFLTENEAFGLL